jgi:hypothetical protein
VEDLRARAQRLREAPRAGGHQHEFLDVEPVVGVRAPVQHVHEGHREHTRAGTAEVLVERQARIVGGRARHRQRDTEDRIGAESGLVGRAVQLQQGAIYGRLLGRVHALDLGRNGLDHVLHGAADTLAEIARRVAVAQLHRLALAGGRPGGDHGAAEGARFEPHLDLHGGIAAGIEDLARVERADLGQRARPFARG